MQKRSKPTTDALKIIDHLLYRGKPHRLKALEEVRANDEVGRKIYQLRSKAKLTQAQLANLIGTTASVICRLEDADYEGHSLAMLRRVAAALQKKVEIRFVPIRKSA
jgi:DNA-binding XRE family transcriptional regulator